MEEEIGGPLPDWVSPFPGKMLSPFTTPSRLQWRMHRLEDWLGALVRYSKGITNAEHFDIILVNCLIDFLDIKKIHSQHHVEASKPYDAQSRSCCVTRDDPAASVHTCIKDGDLLTLRNRLEQALHIAGPAAVFSERDTKGETVLHAAAVAGRVEVAELLMELGGADFMNIRSANFEDTPLHFACMEENGEVAKLLVKYGADVNAVNSNGKSALHYACRFSFDLVKFLIEHGANFLLVTHEGRSPLHLSCWYCPEAALYLLDIGTSLGLDERDHHGYTPFLCAVGGGRIVEDSARLQLIQLLLQLKVDLHAVEHTGKNAVHLCCSTDDKELAMVLLAAGVDLHATDSQNSTTLQTAVHHASKRMVSYILTEPHNGRLVDVCHCDDNGETCLHTAAAAANDDIFDLVWSKFDTAAQGEGESSHVGRRSMVDAPNLMGMSPLHFACLMNRRHAACVLVRAGADLTRTNEVRCVACLLR